MSEAAEVTFDGPELDGSDIPQSDRATVEPVNEPASKPEPETKTEEVVEPEAKKPAPPPLTPEQQESVNEAIGKKVAKQREAERQASEYQQQLQDAQRRLQQYEAPIRPDIPPIPDPYEDDFQAKAAHRDAMLVKAAQYDAQIAWSAQQEQQRQQQAAFEEHERLNTTVKSYSETAGKLGITPDELKVAGGQIAPLMPDTLTRRILGDPQGPEITVYLSKNLVELDNLARMDPMDAAVYLENTIKPKAKRPAPKLAPEPTDRLSGASMREPSKGPKGVVYE